MYIYAMRYLKTMTTLPRHDFQEKEFFYIFHTSNRVCANLCQGKSLSQLKHNQTSIVYRYALRIIRAFNKGLTKGYKMLKTEPREMSEQDCCDIDLCAFLVQIILMQLWYTARIKGV